MRGLDRHHMRNPRKNFAPWCCWVRGSLTLALGLAASSMATTLELTALLAGARPSIESLLSRCAEPLLDVNGRLVKLNLVHVSSTGVEGSLRANSVLLLHVDVVVVLESVRMLLACTHTPGAADDLQRSVGGLTAQHFIGDEASPCGGVPNPAH